MTETRTVDLDEGVILRINFVSAMMDPVVRFEHARACFMSIHIVEQGECLSKIAARYGFRNFRTIYEHPANADLRSKRPNPNLLFPGDSIFIPDKTSKEEAVPDARLHRFQMTSSRRFLRLVIQGLDGKAMASTEYDLEIEGNLQHDVTGPDGLIECWIPAEARNGSLTIRGYSWPLSIGDLNPLDKTADQGVSGIQARLKNLGYDPGPIDGISGPLTEAAIREFQADNPPLAVDGVCGPKTRAILVQVYGC
jgi:N-acetylmuramoyl-L-alanine amidase